jgi:glucose/arabinose dehydrogenase
MAKNSAYAIFGVFLLFSASSAGAYDIAAWFRALLAEPPAPVVTSTTDFRVETVAAGFESPWAIAFADKGRILVTERPGRLRVVRGEKLLPAAVSGVPQVFYRGQGGLLDLVLHPDYARNRLLYLAYSVEEEGAQMTRVARFRDDGDALTAMEVIFSGFPVDGKTKHFGCRLAFGGDGKLYLTLGERGEGSRAQDLGDLNGKTLRLNPDGSIPADNPFVDVPDARPEIFSYGHRNAQGMAVQPGSGLIFQTEHGPTWNDAPGGGDEVNIVERGKNYGWPVIHHREDRTGLVPPLLEYTPAIAPSGAMFYTGDAFPAWRGSFFFATLVGRKLIRVELDGRRPVRQEFLLEKEYGRLRDVAQGPDGLIYVLTSDTDAYGPGREGGDRLLRLVPGVPAAGVAE